MIQATELGLCSGAPACLQPLQDVSCLGHAAQSICLKKERKKRAVIFFWFSSPLQEGWVSALRPVGKPVQSWDWKGWFWGFSSFMEGPVGGTPRVREMTLRTGVRQPVPVLSEWVLKTLF